MKTIRVKHVSELKNYVADMLLVIASKMLSEHGSYYCLVDGIKTRILLDK